jgi:ribonuclease-3
LASNSREPSGTPQGDPGGFLVPFGLSVDPELLQLALTHRSWAYEHGAAPHNERLEFLGDSILGQAVTVKLYRDYPELSEGELAKRRAALVSTVALAEVARSSPAAATRTPSWPTRSRRSSGPSSCRPTSMSPTASCSI